MILDEAVKEMLKQYELTKDVKQQFCNECVALLDDYKAIKALKKVIESYLAAAIKSSQTPKQEIQMKMDISTQEFADIVSFDSGHLRSKWKRKTFYFEFCIPALEKVVNIINKENNSVKVVMFFVGDGEFHFKIIRQSDKK